MAQIENGKPPVEYRLITGRRRTQTFQDAAAFRDAFYSAVSKQAEAKAKALRNCTTDELLAELRDRLTP